MIRFLASLVFVMTLSGLAVAQNIKADDEATVDTTVRRTPTIGAFATDNPEKCQFGSNAGTAFESVGAFIAGQDEPTKGTGDGSKAY